MRETMIEVIDTATGDARKTGKGAVFTNRRKFERAIRDLKRLDAPPGARFLFDVYAEGDDFTIEETYRIDEDGFRAILGEEPKTPEEYVEVDKAYWSKAIAAYREEHPNALRDVRVT